jgi:peptidoglycan/xylan/chitin deacetylase (PgdA/CDA1 family)
VTFDDGFRNNYTVAAPILQEFGLPATFYVTSNFVDSNEMSWVDRIEAAVASTPVKEIRPRPPLNPYYWLDGVEERIRFMMDVRSRLKAGTNADLLALADELVSLLIPDGWEPERIPELDDKMRWDEVASLGRDELFTIGLHGASHRILAHLSESEEWWEVSECIARASEIDAGWVRHFSYPEGFLGSFSERTIKMLRSLGVSTAVTTQRGSNRLGQDVMRLRRNLIA